MKRLFTLCIVHQGDQVLLGMKKRGFGQGKWNGFGGKVKERENIEEAMKRELQEEAGIVPRSFEKKALFEFHFKDNPVFLEVHVFHISSFQGNPLETEEMRPQWFSQRELPFEEMWPDDRHWLPLFLQGKSLQGTFRFQDENNILDYTLEEIENIQ